MGFAAGYLDNKVIRDRLILSPTDPDCGIIVIIPAYKEPDLINSLESLYNCLAPPVFTEVLIFFNTPGEADKDDLEVNRAGYREAGTWIRTHPSANMRFHLISEEDPPEKKWGAGLARKVLMDEAVRRFNDIRRPSGIILSLDADTTVDPDYLIEVYSHLSGPLKTNGCSLAFEHTLEDVPEPYRTAAQSYELHLRYYLHAVRYTAYPFAYYTIGSAFAVKASAYVSQGGMNRKQGGEDFYFIQKLAKTGRYSDCLKTTVHPSARPSERVPFGTGPAIRMMVREKLAAYPTYQLVLFEMLRDFFGQLDRMAYGEDVKTAPVLGLFLQKVNFGLRLEEIRSNTAGETAFKKRFFQWFDGLMILKFLHFSRDCGYNDVPVETQTRLLLESLGCKDCPESSADQLLIFRKMDRGECFFTCR